MTMNSLNIMIVEIVICLALAALLGLLVGWFIQRTIAKRRAEKVSAEAKARYQALEESNRQEVGNLEDQIQDLGTELRSLKSNNQNLNHSLQDSQSSIDKAHSESVEITQAQLQTNERLQSIIREKDLEISRLMNAKPSGNTNLAAAAASMGASAGLVKQISKPSTDETDDLSDETLDATTVIQSSIAQVPPEEITDKQTAETVAALNASANQLNDERQALLDALSEGEETIAIDHRDLPIELQRDIPSSDIDKTIALDDLDTDLGPDDLDDTEMSDTLETP